MVSELEIKNAQLAVELRWARETTLRLSAATTALMQATYRLDRSERAIERRAGALWALKEARRLRKEDEGVSMTDAVESLTSAIERGEVEA